MSKKTWIDCLESCSHLKGKQRTYEAIKTAVLEAGEFSMFDIATRKDAHLFERLVKDPELVMDNLVGYPWVGVKKKEG